MSSDLLPPVSETRTHFKVGSRKSKLAMVQTEYIVDCLKKEFAEYTFEIINFDTKGDKILNVALPKIGDKGLFTKELEDALQNESIDFVVHSLKDMPCQTLPDNLVISGVPEREDPSDALVVAKRWVGLKSSLDELEENSVIGTSSLRRISQLKVKYPNFKFQTIRGNLQTRFAKLDEENEKKFDAIILATAGLKRMGYADRITQILPFETCMHAVSQGALGIECRRNDKFVIEMLNRLNHEETLLRCVAERTFLARLEGGCSAPVGVTSSVTANSITLEGIVLDLDGKEIIKDRFEMKFDSSQEKNCPILSLQTEVKEKARKHKLNDSDDEKEAPENKKVKVNETKKKENEDDFESKKHFCFILDLKIDENKLVKSEMCGLHLAEKMKERGADVLINAVKAQVMRSSS